MTKNELQSGQSRVGYAWDRTRTEPYSAMLRDRDGRIELVIPFDPADEALRRRYIGDMVTWGDDPDLSRFDYTLPEHFWFCDAHGFVSLVGRGSRTVNPLIGTSPMSECRISVRFAVFTVGPDADFSAINGLNSRIEGLGQWFGHRSVTHSFLEADIPRDVVTITVDAPRSEPVHRGRLNLRIIAGPQWSLPGEPGLTSIEEFGAVRTSAVRARPWQEHLENHRAIHELLELAAWQPLGFQQVRAMHARDPQRVLSGDVVGEHWGAVNTYVLPAPEPESSRPQYLFEFGDIGGSGLRRWLRLRDQFRRGINAMTFSIRHSGTSLDGLISDAGMGLEEIGHKIDLARGGGGRRPHREHVLDVAREVDDLLPFDATTWAAESAKMYADIKHPDRNANRSAQDMHAMVLDNRLVFRVWVARRLGVPRETIRRNMWQLKRR